MFERITISYPSFLVSQFAEYYIDDWFKENGFYFSPSGYFSVNFLVKLRVDKTIFLYI